MNHDKIDYYNYLSRKNDVEAFKRMAKSNDTELQKLGRCKDMNLDLNPYELADDTIQSIRQTLLVRLASHSTEIFTIKSELKTFDRAIRLRKVPIIDD